MRSRVRACLLALTCLIVLTGTSGCATSPTSPPEPELPRERMLSTSDGTVRSVIERRMQQDATLRAWIEKHGMPPYVWASSPRTLVLFDIERDVAAELERPLFATSSFEPVERKIRGPQHMLFSNADRERLGEVRRTRAERAVRGERQLPASIAPE